MPETIGLPTRRGLLGALAGAGLVELAAPILRAQGVKGSRILVCLYDFEGNDSNNLVVPLDGGRYSAYSSARGTLALDEASLLSARTTSGAEIGFHPSMPEMRDFFSMRRLAVIANVGNAVARPAGSLLDGDLKYVPGAFAAPEWAAAFTSSGKVSAQEVTTGLSGRIAGGGIVRLASGGKADSTATARRLFTQFPETAAGVKLQKVASALAQSSNESQFFFVPVRSFSTGANQLESHAGAMRDLSGAMAAFFNATVELGISRNVTTYTDGVFNRTMAPTQRGRSTPAWGGHQLVMGDAVVGAEIYGSFPDFRLGGPSDAGKTGIWIPGITKAQYHTALAKWAGVSDWQIRQTFPSVTQQPELGFLA
jgi:uncharacterized protein (DUF1501 family)